MTDSTPSNPTSSPQLEYQSLLSYFKYLVALSGIFVAVVVTVGGYMFHSNLKDVREDAKQEATRVATTEAKNRVTEAFEEKNINALILAAAKDKVGTITDTLINQQLTTKLEPLQQRISLIGQISENEMRMRMGFRDGLEKSKRLLKTTNDPDVLRFGRSTLAITSEDFETRVQENSQRLGLKGLPMLQNYLFGQHRPQQSVPSDLRGVVQLIRDDSDLNAIAAAFVAFRDFTGENVKMFDFDSVAAWCSRNQAKCQ
jgi:hypothetical protein